MINPSDFEVWDKIFTRYSWEFNQVSNIKTGKQHIAKIFLKDFNNLSREMIFNFKQEINIISKIHHPSFLQYNGFSLKDFLNENKLVIISENTLIYPLFQLLRPDESLFELNKNDKKINQIINNLSFTKKLIIIYGIAAGMSYLHSHNIIHQDLCSINIFIDENYFPKITGLNFATESNKNQAEYKKIKFLEYLAPEILSNLEYSKSSDVFAFGLIICEILTKYCFSSKKFPIILFNDKCFTKLFFLMMSVELNKMPKCYEKMVMKCLSIDQNQRPSFDEIVNELKTNPEFLTKDIDKEEYFNYIKFIDESHKKFESTDNIQDIEDILQSKTQAFNKDKVYLETEEIPDSGIINYFKKYESNHLYSIIYQKDKSVFLRCEIKSFTKMVNLMFQISHPSIIKFIGYYPVNKANNNSKEYVFTEHFSKNLLNYIADFNKKYTEDEYDFTKVLSIIYGIASGMSFLHSNNIIHRDLKPENIILNDFFYPKIAGFHLAKEIKKEKPKANKKIKGTPAYIAPEVYLNKGYSKSSDVYSFSLILYELLTGELPYSTILSPKEIKKFIVDKNLRPTIRAPLPKCYRELIERCWIKEPDLRPTFDEIINELKTNPEFLNHINIKKYHKYIKYIEKSQIAFTASNKIHQLEEFVKFKLNNFPEKISKLNLRNIYETETNSVLLDYDFINIDQFEKEKRIDVDVNPDFKIYILINKQTEKHYIGQIFDDDINYIENKLNELLINLIKLRHPLTLNFSGYSPKNFKNEASAVIVYEEASNGTLDHIIEIEKRFKPNSIFNDTKKTYLHIWNCIIYAIFALF